MMRKILILLALILATAIGRAQSDELNRLTDLVLSLRGGGEKAYNQAIRTLGGDALWTPMDELAVNRTAECRVSDRVPGFRLNSVLTNAENAQRYQTTTGNHLNGADSRFNYSLFEKTLKAGASATYTLNERWGAQTFIFIPFDSKAKGLIPAVSCGGNAFESTSLGGGVIKLTGTARKGEPLTVSVSNSGKENLSYVIINYNSRK